MTVSELSELWYRGWDLIAECESFDPSERVGGRHEVLTPSARVTLLSRVWAAMPCGEHAIQPVKTDQGHSLGEHWQGFRCWWRKHHWIMRFESWK